MAMTATTQKETRFDWGMVLTVVAGLMMLAALYMALVFAPDASNLSVPTERYAQRILYFHVAAAWVGFFAFFITFVAGILYLIKKDFLWDNIGNASVEIGLTFMTMVLITGSIWGKAAWNTWWTWSPRLTISAIGWLMYVGYLMLRSAVDNPPRRAQFAAVFGIVSFLSVPINFMAIRWWRDIHPAVVAGGAESGSDIGMGADMRLTLIFAVVAFTVFYVALMYHRLRLGRAEHEVETLRQQVFEQS